jgi:predicted alpha/beta-hydrolase family hydrolase
VTDLRRDVPRHGLPAVTLVLAHGAGAGMDSAVLDALARLLAGAGVETVRFEFAYMAARRVGKRPPPPKIAVLVPEFAAVLDAVLATTRGPVLIGGKSMGSRVACRLAGTGLDRRVAGVVAIGFPFHPPGKPERTRLDDLAASTLPVLVCQGTRDPFGDRDAVEGYAIGAAVTLRWFEGGDHDLRPPARSGITQADHLGAVAGAVAAFARSQAGS